MQQQIDEFMRQLAQRKELFALNMLLHGYFASAGWTIGERWRWTEEGRILCELFPVAPSTPQPPLPAALRLGYKGTA